MCESNEIPIRLFYKFKNINNFTFSSLCEKYFYFSTPEKLNDPEDCRSPINYESSNKDILNWIKHIKKSLIHKGKNSNWFIIDTVDKVKKDLAIKGKIYEMLETSQRKSENRFHLLSLTDNWNNIFMWDSKDYCANFSGICIAYKAYQLEFPEFDSYFIKINKDKTVERFPYFCSFNNDKYFVLRKVEYDNDRKHFYKPFEESYDKHYKLIYDKENENKKNLEYNFFHKTSAWINENEYRGFYTTSMMSNQTLDDSRVYYKDDTLDSITFGYNVDKDKILEIKDLIKANYSNFKDIKFYILKQSPCGKLARIDISLNNNF